jgi:hypothetical protein
MSIESTIQHAEAIVSHSEGQWRIAKIAIAKGLSEDNKPDELQNVLTELKAETARLDDTGILFDEEEHRLGILKEKGIFKK